MAVPSPFGGIGGNMGGLPSDRRRTHKGAVVASGVPQTGDCTDAPPSKIANTLFNMYSALSRTVHKTIAETTEKTTPV